ncbi:MAG TPA: hypothetical protein VHZ52_04685 [Acidobacteriaceae bacterium]|jgi:hypothetical protein|nr:hypothetical protein [Acidobacteriaceae bacterium]
MVGLNRGWVTGAYTGSNQRLDLTNGDASEGSNFQARETAIR